MTSTASTSNVFDAMISERARAIDDQRDGDRHRGVVAHLDQRDGAGVV